MKFLPLIAIALAMVCAPALANETPDGRTGIFIFDNRYLANNGSYLTNDTCFVSLVKTVSLIPDTTPVMVHAREVAQTNATDWVELLPRMTVGEGSHSYYLPNATNHDVMVTADYVPPSPVVTNLIFQTQVKLVMHWLDVEDLPVVIPHSTLIKED